MTRWVMVADLERCVGCQTCTAACRHANATSPPVQWRKVLDVETGAYPHVSRVFVPVGCQHCADPPCVPVCPTGATRKRPDGIVTIDYDLCIGCAYCDVACPYQARFKIDEAALAYGAVAMQNEIERADPHRLGVAQKCTFCSDRIDFGLAHGLAPGSDPRATPACVNACIADALQFGDIDDPDSNVSRLLRRQRSFRMHEELGTEPGFHYVYGEAEEGARQDVAPPAAATAAGTLRSKGVEPWHQQHWDWKAAGNFMCGGAGTGLMAATAIAGVQGVALLALGLAGMALVALGLFLVLLKIGRPARFIYVLRQPWGSWMAREAWLAAPLFSLAGLAIWLESPGLMIPAGLVAFLFLGSQAMILYAAKGIPAWRTWTIVPLIVATGLTEGAGLLLIAAALLPSLRGIAAATAIAVAALVVLRALAWRSHLRALTSTGVPERTLTILEAFGPYVFLLGAALPLTLIAAGSIAAPAALLLFGLAGACVFAAGAALKFILVTRAGFNQGFALAHTPARRPGMSGPAVKPGWSMP
jgi:phenylacetyl-CoA:acceptor oxidoreductase subunit 1